MRAPTVAAGTILPLTRRLPSAVDPLALYASLSEGGRRPGTILLESADTTTGAGERSLIASGASARVVCRGRRVELRALTANGEALAEWLLASAANGDAAVRPERVGRDRLAWSFPEPSIAGVDERTRLLAPSPLDVLRRIAHGPRLEGAPVEPSHFVAGVIAYDLLELYERLPAPSVADDAPLFEMWVVDRFIVVDHRRHSTTVGACVVGGAGSEARYHDAALAVERLARAVESRAGGPPHRENGARSQASTYPIAARDIEPCEPHVDLDDAAYAAVVEHLKRHIVAGDVFQIVPSRAFRLPCPDPLAAYERLRATNPSPYMFYVASDGHTLFGTSPETCVKVFASEGGRLRVRLKPIAGTAARGLDARGVLDADLDVRREAALRLDAKEAAEHLMLVDLARNDVARVSRPGTRTVTKLLAVERFSRVMHLVSEVEGELDDGLDALHAYAASLNMGTLVGAPKVRAAELLRAVEPRRRGAYGGAVGYLSASGEMDTAIVIRSAVVRDEIAEVRAGAGVVIDSDPAAEAAETRRKAEAVLRALREASASGSDCAAVAVGASSGAPHD